MRKESIFKQNKILSSKQKSNEEKKKTKKDLTAQPAQMGRCNFVLSWGIKRCCVQQVGKQENSEAEGGQFKSCIFLEMGEVTQEEEDLQEVVKMSLAGD